MLDGRVTANGEDSACTEVLRQGPVLDKWDQRPYPGDIRPETPPMDKTSSVYTYTEPIAGGGGGSGGSIWIIAPRVTGHGVISAAGGSANRSCHTEAAVTGGGAGGGADSARLRGIEPGPAPCRSRRYLSLLGCRSRDAL